MLPEAAPHPFPEAIKCGISVEPSGFHAVTRHAVLPEVCHIVLPRDGPVKERGTASAVPLSFDLFGLFLAFWTFLTFHDVSR